MGTTKNSDLYLAYSTSFDSYKRLTKQKKELTCKQIAAPVGKLKQLTMRLGYSRKNRMKKGRDLSRMQIMVKPTSLDGLETEYREKAVHQTAKTLHVCSTYFVGDLVL